MAKRFTAAFVVLVLLLTSSSRACISSFNKQREGVINCNKTLLQIDPIFFVPTTSSPYLVPVSLVRRCANVYGLNTGIATLEADWIYGLSCPLVFCKALHMSGISLTGMAVFNCCQGLSIAAWQNIGEIEAPALSVALWQECEVANKGVQLGLVNVVSQNSYFRNVLPSDRPKTGIYGELRQDSLHFANSKVLTMPGNVVQIGIFNSANDGLQIGIINRNPNSWLPYSPLFNFSRPRQPISQRMEVSGLDLAGWTTFSYTISGLHLPSQTVSEVTYKNIPNKPDNGLLGTEYFRKHRSGPSQPIHLITSIVEYDQHDKIVRKTKATHKELELFKTIVKLAGEADRDIILDIYDRMVAWHDRPDMLEIFLKTHIESFENRISDQGMMAKIAAMGGNEPAYVTFAWRNFFPERKYLDLVPHYIVSDTFSNFRLIIEGQGITMPDMLPRHPELLDQLFLAPKSLNLAEISDAVLDLFFAYSRFSPNQQDVFDRTPLMRLMHHAAKEKHSSLDWKRILVRFNSYGMDWSLTDAEGKGYLDYAVALHVDEMDAVLNLLLKYCNTTLPAANAPSHRLLACARTIDNIKSLVNRGLDLNAKDEKGRTLLHARPVMVKELVELGMDINAKDASGNTPLDYLLNYIYDGTGTMLDRQGQPVKTYEARHCIKVFTELQTPPGEPQGEKSPRRR